MSLTSMLPESIILQLRNILEQEGWPSDYEWSDEKHLQVAVSKGRERLISILLEKGCPVTEHGSSSALLRASVDEMSWPSVLDQLLLFEVGASDRNCRSDTALHLAFINDEAGQALELLMERFLLGLHENATNCDGLSFFHIVCAKSSPIVVQVFLSRFLPQIECQVSATLDSAYAGYTSLHFAVQYAQYETVALLLSHEADLYVQDRNGSTPLHLALNRGDTDMIDLILRNDNRVANCSNNSGLSHFMAACAGSETSVVNEFLHAAKTNQMMSNVTNDQVKDRQHLYAGYTPLHFAAQCGNLQTVQLLLEHGASCFAVNGNRLTPLEIARNLGFELIAEVLHQYAESRKDVMLISWMQSMEVK